jgi:hypothetical protein
MFYVSSQSTVAATDVALIGTVATIRKQSGKMPTRSFCASDSVSGITTSATGTLSPDTKAPVMRACGMGRV